MHAMGGGEVNRGWERMREGAGQQEGYRWLRLQYYFISQYTQSHIR
jgi:hypothetical protein